VMFVTSRTDRHGVQGIEMIRYWKEGNWTGALGRPGPSLRILDGVSVAASNLAIPVLRSVIF